MIRLRLLGSVDLVDDDGRPIDAALRRSKVLAVLAYLAAARPRGFHRREKIAALFWPELPGDRSRAALRITLTRIRDAIGADVVLTRGGEEIAVDPSRVWCDVVALDEELSGKRPLAAADLYRGPLLDGIHIEGTAEELEHWIETERARIKSDLVRALSASADLEAIERAVALSPADEAATRVLIERLIADGHPAAALRAYDSLVRSLDRDIGVAPSAETTALVAHLRTAARSNTSTSPASGTRIAFDAPVSPPRRRAWYTGIAVSLAAVIIMVAGIIMMQSRVPTARAERGRSFRTVRYAGSHVIRGRIASEAFLDSTNNAVVVIGGLVYGEDPKNHSEILNDTWRLRGLRDKEFPDWLPEEVDGVAPAPRWLFGLTYDAAHDRAILHGGARGFTSPCSNDTWILSDASGRAGRPRWTPVKINGPLPPPRGGFRIFYDANTRHLIRFGGHDCFHEFVNETWILAFDDSTLSSGRWRQLFPDSADGAPHGRASYAAAYDARTNRFILHGGNAAGLTAGDVWILEHANGDGVPAWRRVDCAGTTPRLSSHNAAFDSTSGTMVVFGGTDSSEVLRRDLWRVTGLTATPVRCAWSRIPIDEPGPNARTNHSVLFNPRTREILIVGGDASSSAMRDVGIIPNPFDRE